MEDLPRTNFIADRSYQYCGGKSIRNIARKIKAMRYSRRKNFIRSIEISIERGSEDICEQRLSDLLSIEKQRKEFNRMIEFQQRHRIYTMKIILMGIHLSISIWLCLSLLLILCLSKG